MTSLSFIYKKPCFFATDTGLEWTGGVVPSVERPLPVAKLGPTWPWLPMETSMHQIGQDQPPATTKPPPGLTSRAVEPGGARAVAELVSLPGYRWGTLQLPFRSPEHVRQGLEKAGPNALNLVAIVKGQVVGNAGMERMGETPHPRRTDRHGRARRLDRPRHRQGRCSTPC